MDIPIPLLQKIHNYFIHSKESLCTVESCTAGLLSFWLTHLPKASSYFKGGLISYQTELKIKLLGLSPEQIKQEGVVTKNCARSMAQGVKNLINADWALAITGVAGPDLGDLKEPVGKIAFALISKKGQKSQIQNFKGPKRQDIRHQSALFALDFLISELK